MEDRKPAAWETSAASPFLTIGEVAVWGIGPSAHVQAREAHVTEWKDGLAVRITVYIDIEEARTAAEHLAEERE